MRSKQNLLIYPKFQLALILINAAVIAINLLIIFYQDWRFTHHFIEMGQKVGLNSNHAYFKFLQDQQKELLSFSTAGFVFTFFLTSLLYLVISHRLAGPLVRLTAYLDQVSKTGKVHDPIRFRKADFFHELIDSINRALKRLK